MEVSKCINSSFEAWRPTSVFPARTLESWLWNRWRFPVFWHRLIPAIRLWIRKPSSLTVFNTFTIPSLHTKKNSSRDAIFWVLFLWIALKVFCEIWRRERRFGQKCLRCLSWFSAQAGLSWCQAGMQLDSTQFLSLILTMSPNWGSDDQAVNKLEFYFTFYALHKVKNYMGCEWEWVQ